MVKNRPRGFSALATVVAGALVVGMIAGCAAPAPHAGQAPTQSPAPHSFAPWIMGTNLGLYDARDQVINDPAAQRVLWDMGFPIIRMPFRHGLPDAFILRALGVIRALDAVPLVIVYGPDDANALADDLHAIGLVQQVFGGATVYIEFGNEPDLAGFSASAYTSAWNAVIPALKSLAPAYEFAGPVTFQADPAYIASFDRLASPRPDVNTWHEYACYPGSSDDVCLARLTDWTTHVREINAAVRVAIGTTLPSMITEWNLDATADPRYANDIFMARWTTAALGALARATPYGLVAAMQYCVANNPDLSLIDGANALTPEGRGFQMYLSTLANQETPQASPTVG